MLSIKYTAQMKPRMTAPSSKIMLQTQHKKEGNECRNRHATGSWIKRRINMLSSHTHSTFQHDLAHAQQSKKDGTLCRKANKKRTPSRRTDNTARITKPKNGDKTNLSMTHEMPQNPLCNIISVHTETNRHSHRIKKRPVANGAQ